MLSFLLVSVLEQASTWFPFLSKRLKHREMYGLHKAIHLAFNLSLPFRLEWGKRMWKLVALITVSLFSRKGSRARQVTPGFFVWCLGNDLLLFPPPFSPPTLSITCVPAGCTPHYRKNGAQPIVLLCTKMYPGEHPPKGFNLWWVASRGTKGNWLRDPLLNPNRNANLGSKLPFSQPCKLLTCSLARGLKSRRGHKGIQSILFLLQLTFGHYFVGICFCRFQWLKGKVCFLNLGIRYLETQ